MDVRVTQQKVGTCSLDDGKRHEQSAVSSRGDRGGVHLLEEREFGHCRRAEAICHVNLLRTTQANIKTINQKRARNVIWDASCRERPKKRQQSIERRGGVFAALGHRQKNLINARVQYTRSARPDIHASEAPRSCSQPRTHTTP